MRIFSASRIGRKPARKGGGAEASGFMRRISSHIEKSGSSRKVGGANKGLGEAPKSCTRKEHESATNSIAKRGQGAIAPCRVKGQRPLWGLGQRPNSSTGDQYAKRTQQRCRQRSVPASNFARPQTRPQAALPQRFREEQQKTVQPETAPSSEGKVGEITPWRPSWRASSLRGTPRRSR